MGSEIATSPATANDPRHGTNPPRLLDLVRQIARARAHPDSAAEAFAVWTGRFVLFQNKRHPRELGLGRKDTMRQRP